MNKMTIDGSGNQVWHNAEGKIHRVDGPAIVGVSGSQEWYLNGKRHRVDGPAITYTNGTQEWYLNGVIQPDYFGKKPNEKDTSIDTIISLIDDLIKAEFAKKNATNVDQVYAKMQQLEKYIAILRSL